MEIVDPIVLGGSVALGIFLGILVCLKVGRLLGERAIARHGTIGSNIGSLEAALLAGYQGAGEKGYEWIRKFAFAGIVAVTVYVILDIEYPRLGFVRIDAIDHMLVDVRAGMK